MAFSKRVKAVDDGEISTSHLDPDITAVFDGDELIYGVGFACEERLVQAQNLSEPDGKALFKNKTQMVKFLSGIVDKKDIPNVFSIENIVKAEPLANALSTVKRTINNVRNKLKAGNYEIYIGGKGNFRDELPLPSKYKDRDNTHKPLLFQEIKDYLINYHDAVIVDGREADDVITSRMYDGFKSKQKIVGVTQDKDATQASGWLYNAKEPKTPEVFIKGLGELYMKNGDVKGWGRKFLYAQCLVGDGVDTYNPRDLVCLVKGNTPSFGHKTCFNLLNPCKTDKECLQIIVNKYKEWFGEDTFTYTDIHGNENTKDWVGAFQMYVDCAYMQRWEGDRLDVMKLLNKVGVDYESVT